jgi:hypothetical protein
MRWSVAVLLFLLLSPGTTEAADKVRVAVAKVRARATAKPDKLETGIRAGLGAVGTLAVTSNALAKASRDVAVKADSPEGARAAGADYLIRVKMTAAKKKKFVAEAELVRASDGEVVEKTSRTYAGPKALATGKTIGRLLGAKAKELGKIAAPAPEAAPPPPVAKTKPISPDAPDEPVEPEDPEPRTKSVAIEPKEDDDDKATAKTEVGGEKDRSGREDGYLRAGVAGGGQFASAYTVAVGGTPTGLAYTLTPIGLVNAHVLVRIPQIGIFFGGRFDFSPVKYEIDVTPPVEPPDPSGRFLSAGGHVGYGITIDLADAFRLRISPLIGVAWDSLSVQEQGDNTVIVSWSAIDFNGGLDLGFILFDALVIELSGRAGYVLSYSEKPTTTGDGGKGFDLLAGFAIRYWIIDLLGLYVEGAYGYQKIGMKGTGTRVGFIEDPPIVDATIFSADLKLAGGVMFGF